MMVDPTKLKPRCLRSLLNLSDSGVLAGICRIDAQRFARGLPSTNCQQYLSKLPNSFWTARNARAFLTADSIFSRLRMIAGLTASLSIFALLNRATFWGSNWLNALR